MALRLRALSLIETVWVLNHSGYSCCCTLEKDTLRHFFCLSDQQVVSTLQSYIISKERKKKEIRTATSSVSPKAGRGKIKGIN